LVQPIAPVAKNDMRGAGSKAAEAAAVPAAGALAKTDKISLKLAFTQVFVS
jgi:hypothetical protein